jgi:hypothetical protein
MPSIEEAFTNFERALDEEFKEMSIAADDNFFLLQLERLTQKHYHYRLSQYTGVANAQFKFQKQKEILHRPSLA